MNLEITLGFICAGISFFFPKIGGIFILIGLAPLLLTILFGVLGVVVDPSTVAEVNSNIIQAFASWLQNEILGYVGAVIFGSTVGVVLRMIFGGKSKG
jgi:hypothetical protein